MRYFLFFFSLVSVPVIASERGRIYVRTYEVHCMIQTSGSRLAVPWVEETSYLDDQAPVVNGRAVEGTATEIAESCCAFAGAYQADIWERGFSYIPDGRGGHGVEYFRFLRQTHQCTTDGAV